MSVSVRFVQERPPSDPRRFEAGGLYELDVLYGWPTNDLPQVGDRIEPDGSDDDFEEGVWEVVGRAWQLQLRGPRHLVVRVERRG